MHVSFYGRTRIWVLAGWRNRAVTFKAVVYALVRAVNTTIDYGVFLAAHAVLGLPLIAANTLSWMVAVSVSYMLNSTITFAAESGRKLRWLAYFTFVASGMPDGLLILRRSWSPSRPCFYRCGWQSCWLSWRASL
jgi:hypothetical protein